MPLTKNDKDYLFSSITPINPTAVDIDRVFTNLLPLLKYEGVPITRGRREFITIDGLAATVCRDDTLHFQGFANHPQIVRYWLESDFLSLVHRGKADKQQVAAPLPMHLNTYKLRNPKHCRDYGVADQIFSLLYYGAQNVMKELRDFLFQGADYYSDQYDGESDLDIETLLMMRILDQKDRDYSDDRKAPDVPYPFCIGQARILGDDIARLLAYQHRMPRLVLISHLKNVMALHVSIYMLRLFQIVPDFVARGEFASTCRDCPVKANNPDLFDSCTFSIHLLTDMDENYRNHMAELARQQFNVHLEQLNTYVRAHIMLKKLQEFGDDLLQRGCIEPLQSLEQILALRNYGDPMEIKTFFEIRIRSLMSSGSGTPDERLVAIRRMGLSELDTYVEMIYLLRQSFHQSIYKKFHDSIFQKNRDTGLMRQGYGRTNKRRYSLGSGLLETLIHIAVLEPSPDAGFRSRNIRVDDFIDWLQRRYGIFISRLPATREPSIADLEALRLNVQAFKDRLREIGFYTDLSDAYISQVIQPRYRLE
jgi:hypothetical protein